MTLDTLLDESRRRIENALDQWLPAEHIQPARLHQAMRYSALGGGKYIRPTLVYATGKALGLEPRALDAAACAVELVHAYSLIHDDLPAMDDDDLRRGRATSHKAFDEATAILAGDALQALAFHVLAHDPHMSASSDQRLRMIDVLAIASGSRGMAGGQALDMAAVGQELDQAQLENIHIHKTGALIRAAVQLGAMSGNGADKDLLARLDRYAKCIGLAFQVHDDILDVESDTETLGKDQGSDRALNKPTYYSILGVSGAREVRMSMHDEALASIGSLGAEAEPLRWIADYVVQRKR